MQLSFYTEPTRQTASLPETTVGHALLQAGKVVVVTQTTTIRERLTSLTLDVECVLGDHAVTWADIRGQLTHWLCSNRSTITNRLLQGMLFKII